MAKLTIEDAAAIYAEVPVSTNGVRILQLLPGTHDDPIACRLKSVQLGRERLECEAVSYTWDHEEERFVYCNGQPLPVNANAYFGLKRLRYPDRPRLLWIDEICVNQADKKDRAHAVRIFDRIFGAAANVLIWLGPEKDESEKAMDLFPAMVERLRSAGSASKITFPASEMVALCDLFSRPWFGRVWTLQEAVFANDITSVLCGDRQFPYKLLEEFSIRYQEDGDGLYAKIAFDIATARPADSEKPPRFVLAHTHAISQLRQSIQAPGTMYDVQTLLERLRSCGATHDRDRFYTIWPLLPPDYLAALREPRYDNAFTAVDLFRDLAIEELVRNSNLAYLGAAGVWQQRPETLGLLPSWAADWAAPQRTHPFWHLDQDCFRKTGNKLYHLGDSSVAAAGISEDRKTLTVRGKILGALKEVADPFHFTTTQQSERTAAVNAMDSFNIMIRLVRNRQNQIEACSNLIVQHLRFHHGQKYESNDAVQTAENATRAALHRTLTASSKKEGARSGSYVLGDTFIRGSGAGYDKELERQFSALRGISIVHPSWLSLIGDAMTLQDLFTGIAKARRFFVADPFSGLHKALEPCCFFGLGPHVARTGDYVCVLSGCVTPFLIREVGGEGKMRGNSDECTDRDGGKQYHLVGECYIDGLMDGEALWVDEVPFREIELL